MKQLGLAAAQYSQDYDEYYLPWSTSSTGPDSNGPTWVGVKMWPKTIYPYVNSTQVFICPSDAKDRVNFVGYPGRAYDYNSSADPVVVKSGSYVMNAATPNAADPGNPPFGCVYSNTAPQNGYSVFRSPHPNNFPGIKQSAVESPSKKIFMFDGLEARAGYIAFRLYRYCTESDYDGKISTREGGTATTNKIVSGRHMEGFNTLYADGHVKWKKYGRAKPEEYVIQIP